METYQTSRAMIDDAKLVSGEEGFVYSIDVELVRDGAKNGMFDPGEIPDDVRRRIISRVNEVAQAVRSGGRGPSDKTNTPEIRQDP